MASALAINGAPPITAMHFPSVTSAAGRTFGAEEMANLQAVMQRGMLNRSGGVFVPRVEESFAAHLGVESCTASTSGTAAIHVAVGAVNPDPGAEIITSPVTDMGTVIPILAQNAIPVFADLRRDNMGLDAADVERRITERTRAIMPVHLAGNATDMDPLMALAAKHNLTVIEDCSQAYGTLYKGRHVGTIGHIGTFSLQQSKHITCGDGGLTVTRDPALADRIRLFANKGWPNYGKSDRDYVMFGMNYRMTELQAAVVVAQIDKVDRVTQRRAEIGETICAAVRNLTGLTVPSVTEGGRHTCWFLGLLVDQEVVGVSTSRLAQALAQEGAPVGAHYIGRPIFMYDLLRNKRIYGNSEYPFSLQPEGRRVRYEKGETPATEKILDDLLQVAVNENYTDEHVRAIIACFEKVWAHLDEL